MQELESALETFCHGLELKFSPVKKTKKRILKTEMDLMIILDQNVISNYLQGYSTEEIALKYDFEPKTVDDMIDLYNYFYN